MKMFAAALLAVLCFKATAQDYPLQSRPKPTTATLVVVCEHRMPALAVAVFTYPDGHVLIVNGQQMQGFKDAREIAFYAASAGDGMHTLVQTCGDTTA